MCRALRERIHEAAKKLGYRPSLAARASATGRTSLVTLWSYHPYEAFFATVVEGVLKQAQEHGYGLLVADIAGRDADESETRACLAQRRDCGDGLRPMAATVLQSRPRIIPPSSAWGRRWFRETDTVQLDLSNAFRQATEHLVAEGCRRIAYLSFGPEDDSDVLAQCYRAPRMAYQAIMEKVGLEEEYIHLDTDTRAESRRTLVDYVESTVALTASSAATMTWRSARIAQYVIWEFEWDGMSS